MLMNKCKIFSLKNAYFLLKNLSLTKSEGGNYADVIRPSCIASEHGIIGSTIIRAKGKFGLKTRFGTNAKKWTKNQIRTKDKFRPNLEFGPNEFAN